LNWTRLVHFRVAFAQFFDHPSSHHHFREIESGTIVFGKNFRSTAILFVGWLAAQLGWKFGMERAEIVSNWKIRRGERCRSACRKMAMHPLALSSRIRAT
jgi:glucose-6-phosphate dehydrogenase assembly protein OpcA